MFGTTRGRVKLVTRITPTALAAVFCVACLYEGGGQAVEPADIAQEIDSVKGVPVVQQESTTDCGAAALSAILTYWGIDSTPQQIRQETANEETTISAGELRDYVRGLGLDAFVVRGTMNDLTHEVRARRPVLVGMNKPYVGEQWFAHYEVVTGVGPSKIMTMDPAHGWRVYSTAAFEVEWGATDHVTLIIAPH